MRARWPLSASLLALGLTVALASCGGGDTSTDALGTVAHGARPLPAQTYLPELVKGGRHFVEPEIYRFGPGSELVATHLRWHDWGEARATAAGLLVEQPASGLVDTFHGTVVASALRTCEGARYYTEVFAHLPPQADLVPTEPTKVPTPCG